MSNDDFKSLPCPFCGYEEACCFSKENAKGTAVYEWIECDSCKARGPRAEGAEDPYAFWNNRIPIEQEAANRVAAALE